MDQTKSELSSKALDLLFIQDVRHIQAKDEILRASIQFIEGICRQAFSVSQAYALFDLKFDGGVLLEGQKVNNMDSFGLALKTSLTLEKRRNAHKLVVLLEHSGSIGNESSLNIPETLKIMEKHNIVLRVIFYDASPVQPFTDSAEVLKQLPASSIPHVEEVKATTLSEAAPQVLQVDKEVDGSVAQTSKETLRDTDAQKIEEANFVEGPLPPSIRSARSGWFAPKYRGRSSLNRKSLFVPESLESSLTAKVDGESRLKEGDSHHEDESSMKRTTSSSENSAQNIQSHASRESSSLCKGEASDPVGISEQEGTIWQTVYHRRPSKHEGTVSDFPVSLKQVPADSVADHISLTPANADCDEGTKAASESQYSTQINLRTGVEVQDSSSLVGVPNVGGIVPVTTRTLSQLMENRETTYVSGDVPGETRSTPSAEDYLEQRSWSARNEPPSVSTSDDKDITFDSGRSAQGTAAYSHEGALIVDESPSGSTEGPEQVKQSFVNKVSSGGAAQIPQKGVVCGLSKESGEDSTKDSLALNTLHMHQTSEESSLSILLGKDSTLDELVSNVSNVKSMAPLLAGTPKVVSKDTAARGFATEDDVQTRDSYRRESHLNVNKTEFSNDARRKDSAQTRNQTVYEDALKGKEVSTDLTHVLQQTTGSIRSHPSLYHASNGNVTASGSSEVSEEIARNTMNSLPGNIPGGKRALAESSASKLGLNSAAYPHGSILDDRRMLGSTGLSDQMPNSDGVNSSRELVLDAENKESAPIGYSEAKPRTLDIDSLDGSSNVNGPVLSPLASLEHGPKKSPRDLSGRTSNTERTVSSRKSKRRPEQPSRRAKGKGTGAWSIPIGHSIHAQDINATGPYLPTEDEKQSGRVPGESIVTNASEDQQLPGRIVTESANGLFAEVVRSGKSSTSGLERASDNAEVKSFLFDHTFGKGAGNAKDVDRGSKIPTHLRQSSENADTDVHLGSAPGVGAAEAALSVPGELPGRESYNAESVTDHRVASNVPKGARSELPLLKESATLTSIGISENSPMKCSTNEKESDRPGLSNDGSLNNNEMPSTSEVSLEMKIKGSQNDVQHTGTLEIGNAMSDSSRIVELEKKVSTVLDDRQSSPSRQPNALRANGIATSVEVFKEKLERAQSNSPGENASNKKGTSSESSESLASRPESVYDFTCGGRPDANVTSTGVDLGRKSERSLDNPSREDASKETCSLSRPLEGTEQSSSEKLSSEIASIEKRTLPSLTNDEGSCNDTSSNRESVHGLEDSKQNSKGIWRESTSGGISSTIMLVTSGSAGDSKRDLKEFRSFHGDVSKDKDTSGLTRTSVHKPCNNGSNSILGRTSNNEDTTFSLTTASEHGVKSSGNVASLKGPSGRGITPADSVPMSTRGADHRSVLIKDASEEKGKDLAIPDTSRIAPSSRTAYTPEDLPRRNLRSDNIMSSEMIGHLGQASGITQSNISRGNTPASVSVGEGAKPVNSKISSPSRGTPSGDKAVSTSSKRLGKSIEYAQNSVPGGDTLKLEETTSASTFRVDSEQASQVTKRVGAAVGSAQVSKGIENDYSRRGSSSDKEFTSGSRTDSHNVPKINISDGPDIKEIVLGSTSPRRESQINQDNLSRNSTPAVQAIVNDKDGSSRLAGDLCQTSEIAGSTPANDNVSNDERSAAIPETARGGEPNNYGAKLSPESVSDEKVGLTKVSEQFSRDALPVDVSSCKGTPVTSSEGDPGCEAGSDKHSVSRYVSSKENAETSGLLTSPGRDSEVESSDIGISEKDGTTLSSTSQVASKQATEIAGSNNYLKESPKMKFSHADPTVDTKHVQGATRRPLSTKDGKQTKEIPRTSAVGRPVAMNLVRSSGSGPMSTHSSERDRSYDKETSSPTRGSCLVSNVEGLGSRRGLSLNKMDATTSTTTSKREAKSGEVGPSFTTDTLYEGSVGTELSGADQLEKNIREILSRETSEKAPGDSLQVLVSEVDHRSPSPKDTTEVRDQAVRDTLNRHQAKPLSRPEKSRRSGSSNTEGAFKPSSRGASGIELGGVRSPEYHGSGNKTSSDAAGQSHQILHNVQNDDARGKSPPLYPSGLDMGPTSDNHSSASQGLSSEEKVIVSPPERKVISKKTASNLAGNTEQVSETYRETKKAMSGVGSKQALKVEDSDSSRDGTVRDINISSSPRPKPADVPGNTGDSSSTKEIVVGTTSSGRELQQNRNSSSQEGSLTVSSTTNEKKMPLSSAGPESPSREPKRRGDGPSRGEAASNKESLAASPQTGRRQDSDKPFGDASDGKTAAFGQAQDSEQQLKDVQNSSFSGSTLAKDASRESGLIENSPSCENSLKEKGRASKSALGPRRESESVPVNSSHGSTPEGEGRLPALRSKAKLEQVSNSSEEKHQGGQQNAKETPMHSIGGTKQAPRNESAQQPPLKNNRSQSEVSNVSEDQPTRRDVPRVKDDALPRSRNAKKVHSSEHPAENDSSVRRTLTKKEVGSASADDAKQETEGVQGNPSCKDASDGTKAMLDLTGKLGQVPDNALSATTRRDRLDEKNTAAESSGASGKALKRGEGSTSEGRKYLYDQGQEVENKRSDSTDKGVGNAKGPIEIPARERQVSDSGCASLAPGDVPDAKKESGSAETLNRAQEYAKGKSSGKSNSGDKVIAPNSSSEPSSNISRTKSSTEGTANAVRTNSASKEVSKSSSGNIRASGTDEDALKSDRRSPGLTTSKEQKLKHGQSTPSSQTVGRTTSDSKRESGQSFDIDLSSVGTSDKGDASSGSAGNSKRSSVQTLKSTGDIVSRAHSSDTRGASEEKSTPKGAPDSTRTVIGSSGQPREPKSDDLKNRSSPGGPPNVGLVVPSLIEIPEQKSKDIENSLARKDMSNWKEAGQSSEGGSNQTPKSNPINSPSSGTSDGRSTPLRSPVVSGMPLTSTGGRTSRRSSSDAKNTVSSPTVIPEASSRISASKPSREVTKATEKDTALGSPEPESKNESSLLGMALGLPEGATRAPEPPVVRSNSPSLDSSNGKAEDLGLTESSEPGSGGGAAPQTLVNGMEKANRKESKEVTQAHTFPPSEGSTSASRPRINREFRSMMPPIIGEIPSTMDILKEVIGSAEPATPPAPARWQRRRAANVPPPVPYVEKVEFGEKEISLDQTRRIVLQALLRYSAQAKKGRT
ncbi:hypothetical protein EW145_g3231 [Phellinidium pouzarii]|uniref:Uncharacterized protein n=1 Tax=Phellinidium pouzarii TaxID=167371 RepID=A0A4S4L834_9AGAM|nr:hypothetical protein EW145_g3231 [Phellinidium pouzarii]